MEPDPVEAANVARALKKTRSAPVAWRSVTAGGYTPARRWIVSLEDGSSAFVKVGTDELTASWIRDEHVLYSVLRGSSFLPGYLGFADDGAHPVLALEDLSRETWPPPWSRPHVDAVLACLDRVHATDPPEGSARAADDAREVGGGWEEIARDPGPFLSLGLCSDGWLSANLEALRAAASAARFGGDALLHFDVRSDNICLRPSGAVLVDWNVTAAGNPEIDVVFWLPSLQAEGGPPPEEVSPDASLELVSACAGYFCARAGRPPIPTAPRVREVQLAQARTALPWAARALGLGWSGVGPLQVQPAATIRTVSEDRPVDVIQTLRGRGLRMTPQRRAIVTEIMRTQGHISPTALARKVQGDMPGVNASTIYRTLSLLEEAGVLSHAHLEGGAEYHRAEEAGHVHLTCSNCGAEDDLSLEEAASLSDLIERHHGFVPDLTHFAISGLCADCHRTIG